MISNNTVKKKRENQNKAQITNCRKDQKREEYELEKKNGKGEELTGDKASKTCRTDVEVGKGTVLTQ